MRMLQHHSIIRPALPSPSFLATLDLLSSEPRLIEALFAIKQSANEQYECEGYTQISDPSLLLVRSLTRNHLLGALFNNSI